METLNRLLHATACLLVLCLGLVPARGMAGGSESLEYAVKAAYLTKFGIYVEWPSTAFASPSSTLNLCVIGDDPFGAALDTAAGTQRIDGRAIAVRRLKAVTRDAGCHILYVSNSEAQRSPQIIDSVRGSGVLTVGDARANGSAAPVISFVIKDNRVRFNVDEEAAAQNGLTISSKLLSLAWNVKLKPGKEGH